ncbi:ComF family protein [Streptomyces sp. TRM 70351]|uniref:ComF family protein n=1 Tax=Streptomyces sp. TRM 70351 TaxID=3116552 RepID=UPI002E7AC790|nr:ComF family protein [Streptomyces sp. TRM 70351]MEE1928063.1 ComF family protein [Streptomyces sp. TRM 70351]
MRGWWQELADLVLAAECAGCGAPRAALCGRCRGLLTGDARRGASAGAVPVAPAAAVPGGLPVYAAGAYADEVRAVLLAHKERGALRLTDPLGAALAGAVRAVLGGVTGWGAGPDGGRGAAGPGGVPLLVPVPSGRSAVAARGHDPVRRMALAAAASLRRDGVPARVLGVLRQQREVADQSGLGAGQRRRNLAGALAVPAAGARLLGDGPVVLVDDLMTTGASLAEAARAVSAAGGRLLGAAVVAAAPVPPAPVRVRTGEGATRGRRRGTAW